MSEFLHLSTMCSYWGRKKARSDHSEQVNSAPEQVKMRCSGTCWARKISLNSLVSLNENVGLINDTFHSEAVFQNLRMFALIVSAHPYCTIIRIHTSHHA